MSYVLSSLNRFKNDVLLLCEKKMGLGAEFVMRVKPLDASKALLLDSERFEFVNDCLVSYWYYPYKENTMLMVMCKRVLLTACPFWGLGKDDRFESLSVQENMTMSDIVSHMKEIKEGTSFYNDHICRCDALKVDKRCTRFKKIKKTFLCHMCGVELSSKQRWLNHGHKRVCVVQKLNHMLRKKKV